MRLPEFTAEASLYKRKEGGPSTSSTTLEVGRVLPQTHKIHGHWCSCRLDLVSDKVVCNCTAF